MIKNWKSEHRKITETLQIESRPNVARAVY